MTSSSPVASPRPSAADAASRAAILVRVAVHALMQPPRAALAQLVAGKSDAELAEATTMADAKREEFWSALGPLRDLLSPWELEFSKASFVTMTADQQLTAMWRAEAFQALAWALGTIDALPPYGEQAGQDILRGFAPDGLRTYIERAALRPPAEIDRARTIAEMWHWRSRTRELVEMNRPFPDAPQMRKAGLASWDDVVRFSARRSAEEGLIPTAIDDDFPVFGKAYRDLTAEEWSPVRSMTVERHVALNWLCGYAPGNRWDETPTET